MRVVVVYQREPHPNQLGFRDVAQPATYAERCALAQKTREELQLDVEVWVDDLGDTSRATFGDLPNPAIVVDARGKVALKLAWCDPKVLEKALPEILADQPQQLPPPAERGFLDAVGDEEQRRRLDPHDRWMMLAWLAVHEPQHADRERWLTELATQAPPQQQGWVEKLRAAAKVEPKPAEPQGRESPGGESH